MQNIYTKEEVNEADWELVSKYIRDVSLARYLRVDVVDVTMALEFSQDCNRESLYDAIKDKYMEDDIINMWLDHVGVDEADELLDWVEYDMLLRN